MINVILACDSKYGIGKNGSIPWPKITEDMEWFKKHTANGVVVMGYNTWASEGMPKPLPNRYNVVVTHRDVVENADLVISDNIKENINQLQSELPHSDVWIIGGANLIDQTYDMVDNWFITRLSTAYDCDTYVKPYWEDFTLLYEKSIDNIPITLVPRFYTDLKMQIWTKT